jgi:hypothetical protein
MAKEEGHRDDEILYIIQTQKILSFSGLRSSGVLERINARNEKEKA